jgi:hypothetical protein
VRRAVGQRLPRDVLQLLARDRPGGITDTRRLAARGEILGQKFQQFTRRLLPGGQLLARGTAQFRKHSRSPPPGSAAPAVGRDKSRELRPGPAARRCPEPDRPAPYRCKRGCNNTADRSMKELLGNLCDQALRSLKALVKFGLPGRYPAKPGGVVPARSVATDPTSWPGRKLSRPSWAERWGGGRGSVRESGDLTGGAAGAGYGGLGSGCQACCRRSRAAGPVAAGLLV